MRRVSEDDGSAAPSYEDEEEDEEGFDEMAGRESLPKQVRDYQGLSALNNLSWEHCPRINYVNNI